MRLFRSFRLLSAAGRTDGRVRLRVQCLEDRAVPAALGDEFHATVIAGSSRGTPADSPDARVDENSTSSPYAGVGSLQIVTKNTSFIATATVIGKRHVLTAAHVVDLNNDGKVDRKDGTQGVYFILNVGGEQTSKIAVTGFNLAPDFTGFNRPSVNDDLAVLTLAEDVPSDVPIYQLPTEELKEGTVLTFVGYGRAGDGLRGYTGPASPTVKRVGENTVDAFFTQDDRGRPDGNETFRFDFDGPNGKGPMGGPTLGNDRETQLGGGDSGGPAFAIMGGSLVLAGVTAFTQGASAPRFGSMGGGVNLYPFLSFITAVMDPPETTPPSTPPGSYTRPPGGSGSGISANPLRSPVKNFPPPPPPPTPQPPDHGSRPEPPPVQEPPPAIEPVPPAPIQQPPATPPSADETAPPSTIPPSDATPEPGPSDPLTPGGDPTKGDGIMVLPERVIAPQ